MIGKIGSGKSAYHLLRYCLEDKKALSETDKIRLSESEGLQHNGRAEVLVYNNCFGNAKELNSQFRDVEKLSSRVEKPVFHISLRPTSADTLSNQQWIEVAKECAKEFDFADHQYLAILHKDAKQPHLHIVANRVGYDGKAASDSNSYKRMAGLCRRMEKQFSLEEVLSPRTFLSDKERQLPRQDGRRQKLKADLIETLRKSTTYPDFETQMKALGYQVLKGRGIAFIDDKKVRIKGSEVGFSLATIEKILRQGFLNPSQKEQMLQQGEQLNKPKKQDFGSDNHPVYKAGKQPEETLVGSLLETLMAYEESFSPVIDPFQKRKRKRKKKNKGQSYKS